MADLTFTQQVQRFQDNENRLDTFINSLGSYTSRFGDVVETIRAFMVRMSNLVTSNFAAAVDATGYFKLYDTLAAANSDIANIPAGRVVEIIADETANQTYTGNRTRYLKNGSTLVFKVDLGNPTGLASTAVGRGGDSVANTVTAAKITSYLGVGDGVANDQSAVAAAVASGRKALFADDNKKFLVTSFDNPDGLEVLGKGAIVKAIQGGQQQLNTYADFHKYAIGKEYLWKVYKRLFINNGPTVVSAYVYGDSTVAGTNVSGFSLLQNLLPKLWRHRGITMPLTVINRAVSGSSTGDTNPVPDISTAANAPTDLFIFKYGINDGSKYPMAVRLANFRTNLRTLLTNIRSATNGDFENLAILLVGPNSTSDTPNGRDEFWYEQLRGIYVQAARDFKCAYFDAYAYLKDSRGIAGTVMDNPFGTGAGQTNDGNGTGRAVHPGDSMHNWIWGGVFDWAFPLSDMDWLRGNHLQNLGSIYGLFDNGKAASGYDAGITLERAAGAGSAPADGMVMTIKNADGVALQFNSLNGTPSLLLFRTWSTGSGTWGAWIGMSGANSKAAPASGYALPGSTGDMRIANLFGISVLEGYVNKTSPSTIPANTTIATVTLGAQVDSFYGVQITAFDGANFQTVQGRWTSGGAIQTLQPITITATRVYASGTLSYLGNT